MNKPEKWRGPRGRWLATLGVMIIVAGPVAAEELGEDGGGGPQWSTLAGVGMEYDDNPLRRDDHEGPGDGLVRYLLGLDFARQLGGPGQVSATLRQGGKFYGQQAEANALVTQFGARASGRGHRRWSWAVLVDLKDRTERGRDRDYSRGGVALRLGHPLGPARLWASGGGRYFTFKPTPTSSHRGPVAQVGGRWPMGHDLALDGHWTYQRRHYDGVAWRVRDERLVPRGPGVARRDAYHQWGVSVHYQDQIDLRLGYDYAQHRSNSYGQGLRRHSVSAQVTVPMPGQLFISGRGELQRARYEDRGQIDAALGLDEDDRNALVAALSRPVGGPWEVALRYGIFFHEFGADREYRRQFVALSITAYLDGE